MLDYIVMPTRKTNREKGDWRDNVSPKLQFSGEDKINIFIK